MSRLRIVLAHRQPLQRLDDGRHARTEGALDHDGVAGTDRGQHLRLERGGVPCIAAATAGGKGLPQGPHQRPATEHQVNRVGDYRFEQAAVQRSPARPQFEHVAKHGDTPSLRSDRCLTKQRERCRHGSGIGIVAVVDDDRPAARKFDLDQRPAP